MQKCFLLLLNQINRERELEKIKFSIEVNSDTSKLFLIDDTFSINRMWQLCQRHFPVIITSFMRNDSHTTGNHFLLLLFGGSFVLNFAKGNFLQWTTKTKLNESLIISNWREWINWKWTSHSRAVVAKTSFYPVRSESCVNFSTFIYSIFAQ